MSLLVLASLAFAQSPETSVGGVEGVWKMCYLPGLEGVYEIDEGYLVLMPNGEYYEVVESCCHLEGETPRPPFWERNTYEIEGASVVLRSRTHAGTEVQRRLVLREEQNSVLFDSPRAEPQRRDVLAVGDTINYGYCRVYPKWPVSEAPHNNSTQQTDAVGAGG